MTEEQQKEQFSIAYVSAVAAAARVNIHDPRVDEDSIDLTFSIKSVAGRAQSPKIDAQLKCVTKLARKGNIFRYPLKAKNYNELVGDHYVPKILVVVLVPSNPKAWMTQSAECLSLYRCGYWASLRGLEESANTANVTVDLPTEQIFSTDALLKLLTDGGAS